MPLNTFVAGNPGSVRTTAEAVSRLARGVDDIASGWQHALTGSESVWEGTAGDAFRSKSTATGQDADALTALFDGLSSALTAFADELTTVQARMAQAVEVAIGGGLRMLGSALILEPGPMPLPPAEQRRQQRAFHEARETVAQARTWEKVAHERLIAALRSNAHGLRNIGRAEVWARVAAAATWPPAAALAGSAAVMDDRAAEATRGAFERAATTGPAAVRGLWGSLTGPQRADLADRFPQLVGNTDGVPVAARDQANRSILGAQRRAISAELDVLGNRIHADFERHGRSDTSKGKEIKQLTEALRGLDALQGRLGASAAASDHYLLGIDSTAAQRGQTIIAHGNPDHADNTMTLVPGTFSDLGDASDYVAQNDKVLARANELSDGKNAAITW